MTPDYNDADILIVKAFLDGYTNRRTQLRTVEVIHGLRQRILALRPTAVSRSTRVLDGEIAAKQAIENDLLDRVLLLIDDTLYAETRRDT